MGDCEKSEDVQWDWDREEEKLIDSGTWHLEPRLLEPRQLEPMRISTSVNKVSADKPWWEQ